MAPRTAVTVAEVMGTVASVRVVNHGAGGPAIDEAVARCIASLQADEARFSPYIADSAVSRIARGELDLDDADPDVRWVAAECDRWTERTSGRFSAHWGGRFDPSGLVKAWAAERAFLTHLAPLLDEADVAAVGLGVGGDIRVAVGADSDWRWEIGIVDPADPRTTLARLSLRDGGVATSGLAERGAHVIDPRSGVPATSVASATVIAPSLVEADVLATAAMVAGFDDLDWTSDFRDCSGMLVATGGAVRRWTAGTEVSVSTYAPWPAALIARAAV